MKYLSFLAILLIPLFAKSQSQKIATPGNVGDIAFDSLTDKRDFYLCHPENIFQYYNFGTTYKGEKYTLRKTLIKKFIYQKEYKKVSGYVVIRFVVNCKGETDRFRVSQIDQNYNPAEFDAGLVEQLLRLTKELKDWIPGKRDGVPIDSYVYLNFIIKNGKLVDVGP